MPEQFSALFPTWPLLSAFLLASLVLAVTPGPAVVYIVARSLSQGRRAGLVSVAGVGLGNFGNALAASVGLATLFALSAAAFTVVKYAGAAYLIYLGVRMWRDASAPAVVGPLAGKPEWRIFRDSFFVALLNPKTTLFFAAFLPQFLSPGEAQILQSVTLGALFVLIAALTDSVYALAAGQIAGKLRQHRNLQRRGRLAGGLTFIGLGLFTALSGQKPQG